MILIGREKHLDHMVKVVPFIVTCYGIQCFVILRSGSNEIGTVGMVILGVLLAMMVMSFVAYDLFHKVMCYEDHLIENFLWKSRKINYQDISDIQVKNPKDAFSSLAITTSRKKITFYFVDDAEKVKEWIEKKKSPEAILSEAA